MNKRIRELASEVGISVDYLTNTKQIMLLEKFAELIVRECANIVENMSPGYDDYRNQIEDAFRRDCVEEIKYKFGVINERN